MFAAMVRHMQSEADAIHAANAKQQAALRNMRR
jgi:hypothetical protein